MILLDSNIWVALLYKKDPNHKKARDLVGDLRSDIIVTEYIIIEVTTILSQRKSKALADTFLAKISTSDKISIFPSSRAFLDGVVTFYLKKKDRQLSFVDYSLLLLSQKIKIVTFDKKLANAIKNLN